MSRYVKADMIGCPCGYCEGYDECQKEVDDAPSIEIVRCGECKRANYEWPGVRCGLSDALMGEDGFCSIGERSE